MPVGAAGALFQRLDQLVAVPAEILQQRRAKRLDARGFRGKDVLDVFGEDPGAHETGPA